MTPRARAIRIVVVTIAAASTALSVLLILGRADSATTYGGAAPWLGTLELATGVALAVAGSALLWVGGRTAVGALAVAASVMWFAPVWVGWDPSGPALMRAFGLALAPLLPIPILLVSVSIAATCRWACRAALGGSAVLLGSVAALTLVRDPYLDRYCWSNCTTDLLVWHADALQARHLTQFTWGLWIVLGAATALFAASTLASAAPVVRRSAAAALVATALSGVAVALSGLVLLLAPAESPDRALHRALFATRAVTLLALAAGLGWLWLRPRVVRGTLARLAVGLDAAGGTNLRDALATTLRLPGLRIAYPVGTGGELVDAEGSRVDDWPGGSTAIVVDGEIAARLASQNAVVDPAMIDQAIGPAARLALGNERLRAESLARLAEVAASRARVVEAGDASRRRLERDLHDGAQQRLLALTFDLRVATTQAAAAGREDAAALLRHALDRAARATAELRDVAHGIFPAALASSGLESALQGLADIRPMRLSVQLPPGRRFPAEMESAAYLVVAEAAARGDEVVGVTVVEHDGSLAVSVEGAVWGGRLAAVEDRVGAVGGSITVVGRRLEASLPLPPDR